MLSDVINGNCWHIHEAVTAHWNNTSLGQREHVGPLFETYKKWLSLTSVAIDWDETSSHNDGRAGLEPEMRWECVRRRRTDVVGEIAVKEIAREDVTSNLVLELIWIIDNRSSQWECEFQQWTLHTFILSSTLLNIWSIVGTPSQLSCVWVCVHQVLPRLKLEYTLRYRTTLRVFYSAQCWKTSSYQSFVNWGRPLKTGASNDFSLVVVGRGDYTRLTMFLTWGSRPSRPSRSHSGTQDDRPSHQWI